MRNHNANKAIDPDPPRSSVIQARFAATLVCAILLYALYCQYSALARHTYVIFPGKFLLFLIMIFLPHALLFMSVKLARERTAWACVAILCFFVVVDFWLFSVDGGAVAPAVGLIELMVGIVLVQIA